MALFFEIWLTLMAIALVLLWIEHFFRMLFPSKIMREVRRLKRNHLRTCRNEHCRETFAEDAATCPKCGLDNDLDIMLDNLNWERRGRI